MHVASLLLSLLVHIGSETDRIVAGEYGSESASSPFGDHSLKAEMGKVEALLVEGWRINCYILADLGYGVSDHIGSFGEHKPIAPAIVPALVPVLVPEPGRELAPGPGPHAAYRQPRLAFVAEHRGQLIC